MAVAGRTPLLALYTIWLPEACRRARKPAVGQPTADRQSAIKKRLGQRQLSDHGKQDIAVRRDASARKALTSNGPDYAFCDQLLVMSASANAFYAHPVQQAQRIPSDKL